MTDEYKKRLREAYLRRENRAAEAKKKLTQRYFDTKVRDDILSRTNAWISNTGELIDGHNERYKDGNKSYRTDSEDYWSSVSGKKNEFDAEADSILALLDKYKGYYDEEWGKKIRGYLSADAADAEDPEKGNNRTSYNSVYDRAQYDRDFFASFESEDAYNKWLKESEAEEKKREGYAKYDSAAGEAEIERIREFAERMRAIDEEGQKIKNEAGAGSYAYKAWERTAAQQRYALSQEYLGKDPAAPNSGSSVLSDKANVSKNNLAIDSSMGYIDDIIDFNSLLTEKEQYHNLATEWQRESELYSGDLDEFERFASIGNELPIDSVGKETTEYLYYGFGYDSTPVQDPDALRLAATALAMHNGQDGGKWKHRVEVDEYLKGLKNEEFERLAYYIGKDQTEGTDTAYEYVKLLDKVINQRKGAKIAEWLKPHPVLSVLYSIPVGLDQFASGAAGLFTDEKLTPSATAYAGSQVRENLETFGKGAFDVLSTTSNMLPSVLTSLAIGTVSKTAGAVVGSALLGTSAAGNAKQEMLNLGYNKDQANAYGLMVGVSEAGLQLVLGGIGKLGGAAGKISKAVSAIDHTFARVAITLGGSMASEALEEGVQTVIEPWLKEIATNVDFDSPNIEEVLYSSLLGAITSLGFEGGGMAINAGVNAYNTAQVGRGYASEHGSAGVNELISKGLSMNESTAAYKQASKLQNKAKTSNYAIGKLLGSMSESQMSTALQARLGENSSTVANTIVKLIGGQEVSDKALNSVMQRDNAIDVLNETFGVSLTKDSTASDVRKAISRATESNSKQKGAAAKFEAVRTKTMKELGVNMDGLSAENYADTIASIVTGEKVSDADVKAVLDNKFARNALNKQLGVSSSAKLTASSTVSNVRSAVSAQISKSDNVSPARFSMEKVGDAYAVVAEAEGERGVISLYKSQRQAQAAVYAMTLGMGSEGSSGFIRISEDLSRGASLGDAAQAFNAIYRQGKQGKALSAVQFGDALTAEQRQYAYQAGIVDGMLDSAREKNAGAEVSKENDGKVLQKDGVGDTIKDTSQRNDLQGVREEVISDPDVQQAKENAIEPERMVYSSEKAMAYDAVAEEKLSADQKKAVNVGKDIGRKVVICDTRTADGVPVDGFLGNDGVIYISKNNKSPVAFIFKHELAHFCERAGQKYQDFIDAVRKSAAFKNWLKEKGMNSELEYNRQIRQERATIGQDPGERGATMEIMANFVGDIMFGDDTTLADSLIGELKPKQKRSVREFLRDFFEWIKGRFTGKGNTARTEIHRLEKMFGQAFRTAVESRAENQELFSISSSLDAELDMVLSGKFDASKNEVYLGETSNFMTEIIGANAFSLYMPASKAYSSLVTEEEYNKKPYYAKQDNYHGIGKADFIEILEKSETPIAAFAASPDESGNKRQNRIVLVTDKIIRDLQSGKDGYAVVVEEVDTKGLRNGKRVNANKTITIYPRTQLFSDIQDAIIDGRILNLSKKGEHLFAGVRGSNPQAAIRKDVLEKNIAHFWMNVKWESEKNKTFSTKEAEMPSAFRLALEKAGYFDRDGHSKYMQKNNDSSQENNDSSSNKKDSGEQFSYTPQNDKIDDVVGRYENGEITIDELKRLLKKPEADNPVSIANLKPEDMNTTPSVNKKTTGQVGDGDSKFAESLQKSKIFDENFKAEVKDDNFVKHYAAITNKETLAEAAARLNEGGEAYVREWLSKKVEHMDTVDTMVGFILLKRFQDVGDYTSATAVAQKVREVGTLSGQRVQAFSIIGRFDADMMQTYAQKELEKAWEFAIKGRSQKWIDKHAEQFKLTDEEITFIRDHILYAAQLPENSRARAIALAQITTLLQNKLPPANFGQSYKAWQRISMLLNPKTQIRNVAGNLLSAPVFVASDWFSTPVDFIVSKFTGVRTTGLTGLRGSKTALKAFGKGAFESFDDWRRHINTKNVTGNRFEIGQGKSFDETRRGRIAKIMNSFDEFTSFLLDAGDRPFYEMWFTNSLNEQMRLNKVSEPTEEMVQIAVDEALSRTWQDENLMTKMVSGIKRSMNHIQIGGYGVGDIIIKFTKTPANLTKAIYDFSPAAIATLTPQAIRLTKAIKNGTVTPSMQKKFVSNFGKMAAGTMLYVAFAALYAAGRITGSSDEDKDVAAFEKYIQGIPAYSIKFGDKWFSYDWAQPIGAVPAIIADYMESRKDGSDATRSIYEAFKAGGSVLYNQSFMSSIQTLFAADDPLSGVLDLVSGEVTVPIPTIFSQLANVLDDKRRVTYDSTSEFKSALNRAMFKIPGLRNTLEAEVDVLGREVENSSGNKLKDFANAFVNPANTYTDTSTDMTDHAYEIYQSTGDVGAIPPKAPYSVDLQGKTVKLSDTERVLYQKAMGEVSADLIELLLENDVYNAMSDEEKLAVLKQIYSYSSAVAKSQLDWTGDYEVINGIAPYITQEAFNTMSYEERYKIVDDYIFSDYEGMQKIESDKGQANFLINKKTGSMVLEATRSGDIDGAVKLIQGIEDRVTSFGWDKEDTAAEIKERKESVKTVLTRYWKAAYRYAYYNGDKEEQERIFDILVDVGLYGDKYEVKKQLRKWIEDSEE